MIDHVSQYFYFQMYFTNLKKKKFDRKLNLPTHELATPTRVHLLLKLSALIS